MALGETSGKEAREACRRLVAEPCITIIVDRLEGAMSTNNGSKAHLELYVNPWNCLRIDVTRIGYRCLKRVMPSDENESRQRKGIRGGDKSTVRRKRPKGERAEPGRVCSGSRIPQEGGDPPAEEEPWASERPQGETPPVRM